MKSSKEDAAGLSSRTVVAGRTDMLAD